MNLRKTFQPKYFFLLMIFSFFISIARAENFDFVYPPNPFPWVIVCILAGVLVLFLGALLTLARIVFGDRKIKVPFAEQKHAERSYSEKLKEEYKRKSEVLNKKLQEVRSQFALVFMKVKNLSTTLDTEKLLSAITDILKQEVGAEKFILFFHDREKNELFPLRWSGYPDDIKENLVIPLSCNHFLTFAFSRRQMVYKLAAVDDPETRGLVERPPLTTTLLAIPIASPAESFGVIHIESFYDHREKLEDADLRFFSSLSSFMGMAFTNANVLIQTKEDLTASKLLSEKEVGEKKILKEIFSKYTSSELVENLIKNPSSLKLGGETREATILFSDIAGFTKFSSKLTPQQVVSTINEYLSKMTEIILDHNGEIDKFIGDAVMARFGVLCDLPSPGFSAVKSAIAMLEALKDLQGKWAQQNREGFSIRIGIASGPVLAGNIGSEKRQEFTVMGTTVNLASRLEALNKELNTTILVDEKTYLQIAHEIRAVPRENISIRGLDGQMMVYEVLGYHEDKQAKPKVISLKEKLSTMKPDNFQFPKGDVPEIEIISAEPCEEKVPQDKKD